MISRLPSRIRAPLRFIRDAAARVSYSGFARWCPVCARSSRRFKPFGAGSREEAQCVHCNSLERHRFVWLYFQNRTDLFDGREKKFLHVAPEAALEPRLRERLGTNYITADIAATHVTIKMDITDVQYPDDTFDVIYCSHVLEHVQEDRRAMRELRRVLKPDGWAVLLVPIVGDITYEDPSITDRAGRLKAFGLEEHVRQYGRDYVGRLRESGFTVEVTEVADLYDRQQTIRMGIGGAAVGEIYYCTKRRSNKEVPACL